MKLIDLSHNITHLMSVYPGDDEVSLIKTHCFKNDGYSNSSLTMSMHIGTHVDGPMHLTDSNNEIGSIDLSRFIGNGFLIDARNEKVINMKEEYNQIKADDIVLIYTGFDQFFGQSKYYDDHPDISKELALFFIERKIKMIGMDFPSPDEYPFEIHQILLKNNILILENLKSLEKLMNQTFELIAFPLHINADSAPVRAVARIK